MGDSKPVVSKGGEGDKRWFFGGGVHTWKATSEQTNGSLIMFEDELVRGKMTPLHRHANEDEAFYVIEGEILYIGDGVEYRVAKGGTIVTPRGVAHAFTVLSESARLLVIQTPGSGEAFYRGASEPKGEVDGIVDFKKIGEVAQKTGVMEVLGPPPFKS